MMAAHLPGALSQFQIHPGGSAQVPYASPRIEDIYGVSPRQLAATADPLLAAIHPDDLAPVNESIRTSALTLALWRNQHRVVLPASAGLEATEPPFSDPRRGTPGGAGDGRRAG